MEGLIKDIIYKKKDVLGLDLGTSSVKFAQLKKERKYSKLIGYGKVEIPENIIVEGVISEPEKLAAILKKNFLEPKWGKISAKRVIASLPEARIFTRVIELPTLSKKDLGEAVNYEVEQSIPIPLSDLYIDYQIFDETIDKISVYLTAAPRAIIDSYIQLFNQLGMESLALEPSLLSIARATVKGREKSPVIILDIGGTTTNIAIFDKDLKVTESLQMGGLNIKSELKEILGLANRDATLAIKAGFAKESKESELIKNEIEKITIEIKKMVDYYEEKNETVKFSKILVSGGLAAMPGLLEVLKEDLNIEARICSPWTNVSIYPLKPVPKEQAPGYAASIGLCLRGFSDD